MEYTSNKSTIKSYETDILLNVLAALLQIQCIALRAKLYGLPKTKNSVPAYKDFNDWSWGTGICNNIFKVMPKRFDEGEEYHAVFDLLETLFLHCPSSDGRAIFPVMSVGDVTYVSACPNDMWGDHPYADNRRKIISECIEQLQTELRRRKVKV